MARTLLVMRAVTTIGSAAVFLSACQTPVPPSPDLSPEAISALEARDTDVVAALGSGDWNAYSRMVTDDVMWMVPEATSIRGKAALETFMAQFASVTGMDVSNRVVRGSGNLAYRTMDYVMKYTLVGSEEELTYSGKLIAVYRKAPDGEWLVETEMWNRNPAM